MHESTSVAGDPEPPDAPGGDSGSGCLRDRMAQSARTRRRAAVWQNCRSVSGDTNPVNWAIHAACGPAGVFVGPDATAASSIIRPHTASEYSAGFDSEAVPLHCSAAAA